MFLNFLIGCAWVIGFIIFFLFVFVKVMLLPTAKRIHTSIPKGVWVNFSFIAERVGTSNLMLFITLVYMRDHHVLLWRDTEGVAEKIHEMRLDKVINSTEFRRIQ